jgi:hypothetical protein
VLPLIDRLQKDHRFDSEVFVQVEYLHLGGGPAIFSSHGAEWMPMLGLGVWPDREPPRSWTREELEDLEEGQRPRTLMHQVFRVTGDRAARGAATAIMLGSGSLVRTLEPASAEGLLERAAAQFLPRIDDSAFAAFRYYMPLMDARTFQVADPAILDQWACGATAYIRESPQDRAILIAARRGLLKPVLDSLHAQYESGERPCWRIRA